MKKLLLFILVYFSLLVFIPNGVAQKQVSSPSSTEMIEEKLESYQQKLDKVAETANLQAEIDDINTQLTELEDRISMYLWINESMVVSLVIIVGVVAFIGYKALGKVEKLVKTQTKEELKRQLTEAGIKKQIAELAHPAVESMVAEYENMVKQRIGQIDKSRQEYEKSLKDLNKTGASASTGMAEDGSVSNEQNDNLEIFTKSLSETKAEIDYTNKDWLYKGIVELKRQNYQTALMALTKAIEYDRNDAVAYNSRGMAYAEIANYNRAISDFNKGIEINSQDSELFLNRAKAFFGIKEYERAISDFSKAITRDSRCIAAYEGRARSYIK
ncbi:MAG: hypothetical protein HGB11_08855, partial [Chlorobiales bacterium]|nr:hypothetical protein [Chlorobiales bacterium]